MQGMDKEDELSIYCANLLMHLFMQIYCTKLSEACIYAEYLLTFFMPLTDEISIYVQAVVDFILLYVSVGTWYNMMPHASAIHSETIVPYNYYVYY
jgi:hypothetical protein